MTTEALSQFVPGSRFRYAYVRDGLSIKDPSPDHYRQVEPLEKEEGEPPSRSIWARPEDDMLLEHDARAGTVRQVVRVEPAVAAHARLVEEAAEHFVALCAARPAPGVRVEARLLPAHCGLMVTLEDRGHVLPWNRGVDFWAAAVCDDLLVSLGDHVVSGVRSDCASAEQLARGILDATLAHREATPEESPESRTKGLVLAVAKLQHADGSYHKTYLRGAPAFDGFLRFVDELAKEEVDQMNSYLLMRDPETDEMGLAAGRYPLPVPLHVGRRSGRDVTEADRRACRRAFDAHFVRGCLCVFAGVVRGAKLLPPADPPEVKFNPVKCPLHRDVHLSPEARPDERADFFPALAAVFGVKPDPSIRFFHWVCGQQERPEGRGSETVRMSVESSPSSRFRYTVKRQAEALEIAPDAITGEVCESRTQTTAIAFESDSARAVAHFLAANFEFSDRARAAELRRRVSDLAGRFR